VGFPGFFMLTIASTISTISYVNYCCAANAKSIACACSSLSFLSKVGLTCPLNEEVLLFQLADFGGAIGLIRDSC